MAHPGAGEVVVAVTGCGVCHTDLGYYYDGVRTNQPLSLALGHEISGRVSRAGAGAEAGWAAPSSMPAVLPCGECDAMPPASRHLPQPEDAGQRHPGGGFGTHIVVPARGLCPVDEAARLAKRRADAGPGVHRGRCADHAHQGGAAPASSPGPWPWSAPAAWAATARRRRVPPAPRWLSTSMPAKLEAATADGGAALALNARELDARPKKAVADFARKAAAGAAPNGRSSSARAPPPGQTSAFNPLGTATLSVVGFTMDKVELRLSNLMAFGTPAPSETGACPPDYLSRGARRCSAPVPRAFVERTRWSASTR